MSETWFSKNKKTLLIIIVVLSVAGLAWFWWKRSAPADVVYREVAVSRGNIEAVILSTGTVQPENRLEIKPPIAGRIDNVLVQEGHVVKKNQVLAWMSSTERAALLDAASAKGPQELKRWEELYRATPILAPINGTIIVRSVEAGQTFTSQDSVFVISDRLTVKAQVDETDVAQIHLKQKAWLVLDAYPDQTIPGHVDQIAYEAKTVNNVTTYVVDVLPEKTPAFMRSGMTANVSFSSASAQNVLLLPSNAVRTRDGRSTVLIKSPDKNAKPIEKEITLGITDGKRVEVSGVTEGEIVLVAQLKPSGGASGTNPFSPLSGRRAR